MTMNIIRTDRLELIPITKELCITEFSSPISLGKELNAIIPDAWPPELVTSETLQEFIALLTAPEGSRFFAYYWVKIGISQDDRILIGSGGFFIREDGIPELGYSVLDDFQCRGYATEAVRAIITWIKTDYSPEFIRACTYPSLPGSIRVLEKNGFYVVGSGLEEGTVEYRLT